MRARILFILLARLGHSVVAFDYTEGMLERASRNAAEADVSIVVRQGDAQDLPFPDETFDLIVSRNLCGTSNTRNQPMRNGCAYSDREGASSILTAIITATSTANPMRRS